MFFQLLGGNIMKDLSTNPTLLVFIGLVIFDYITGILKSVVWKVTDSSVGLKGLIKHTIVIVSIVAIWGVCGFFEVEEIAFGVTIMYGINYLLSVLENFAVMGIYTPKFLIPKLKAELKRYEEKLGGTVEDKQVQEKINKVLGTDTKELTGAEVNQVVNETLKEENSNDSN